MKRARSRELGNKKREKNEPGYCSKKMKMHVVRMTSTDAGQIGSAGVSVASSNGHEAAVAVGTILSSITSLSLVYHDDPV
jgi:hypothetical protein